ncbi:MAG: polysaccharide export protein EpsE [Gammaproteobacteria bacterium]|nr:MAG: polysaccharide export protein EpsE [Gammaproteobacteria bacterium]
MNSVKRLKWCGFLLLLLPFTANAQSNYSIGAGDEIKMTVYGQPELSIDAQVNNDGTVEIPLLGSLKISGRSSGDAAKLIADRYQNGNVLKNPQVNVLITKYRSHVVSILGKVARPGKLVLEGSTSLTQAIAWAGGVLDAGSERIILVRTDANGKQERREYDLQKVLGKEVDNSPIVWLQDGDTLYVPNAGRFYVSGEVRTPGMYPLDRPLNVMQAVGVGGGITTRASERSVKLFRKQTDGSVKELRAKPEDTVQDGDILVVQESLF